MFPNIDRKSTKTYSKLVNPFQEISVNIPSFIMLSREWGRGRGGRGRGG